MMCDVFMDVAFDLCDLRLKGGNKQVETGGSIYLIVILPVK